MMMQAARKSAAARASAGSGHRPAKGVLMADREAGKTTPHQFVSVHFTQFLLILRAHSASDTQRKTEAELKTIKARAGAEEGVAKYSHDLSQGDTDKIISLDDDTQVRIDKSGKASVVRFSDGVPLKGGGTGLSASEYRQFQIYRAEHTESDPLDPTKKVTDEKAAMEDIKANNPQLYRKLRGEKAASSPSGPAPTGKKPMGTGTKADPYKATTQADIDWFKASAPAGAVIVVEGKSYTK
jgi:hypothetical protein